MKYKLLVFDWDGTLANSHPAVVSCMQQTARELQLPVPSARSISAVYGMVLADMICRLFPDVDCRVVQDKFYQNYLTHNYQDQLFADVSQTLQQLQQDDYLMAIATNKSRRGLSQALNALNLQNYFCAIRCGDDGYAKPQPEVLHGILDELSMKAQEAVMIGDSIYDMLAAQNSKVDAIAVCYDLNEAKEQELLQYKPIACVNSISELPGYL